jgi:Family of unknown function (DUF5302)
MTQSAKKDAATAQQAPAAAAEAAAEDTTPAGDAQADPEGEVKPELDDVKAKFREALDRKRQVHAEGQGKGSHEAGKVSGAHGPAASRRSFRRKSG